MRCGAFVVAAVLAVAGCQAPMPAAAPPTTSRSSAATTAPVDGVQSAATPVAPQGVAAVPGACRVVDAKADRRCTPGVANPQVTQLNIASTICRSGWTATIRPPTSYTEPLKRQQMATYAEPAPSSLYEEDHLISLEIGGSPTDPRNLWPEPYAGAQGARTKDTEENSLRKAVCVDGMRLADAQAQIRRDWTR